MSEILIIGALLKIVKPPMELDHSSFDIFDVFFNALFYQPIAVNFHQLIIRARTSSFWLWVLNQSLQKVVPFNQPHRIRVTNITDYGIRAQIPMRRNNLNHIKGIHACGLATVAEFTSGLVLLRRLDSKNFRLIMESIEVKYHYQAKSTATASFELSDERLNQEILSPLKTADSVYIQCEIVVADQQGKHVCTAYTNWQIKPWSKVRTKM